MSKKLTCFLLSPTNIAFSAVAGQLTLVLDDGSEVLVDQPGTTVVMKGNIHAWRNTGPEYARWVTVLVDAEPATVNGEVLEDVLIE